MEYTEEYIIEYADVLDWDKISSMMLLGFSDEFFVRFNTNINWNLLSSHLELTSRSDEFFRKHGEKFNWFNIKFNNRSVTTEFAHKYVKKFNFLGYYKDGRLHRNGGPAMYAFSAQIYKQPSNTRCFIPTGAQVWVEEGYIHRDEGPALILKSGKGIEYFMGHKIQRKITPNL